MKKLTFFFLLAVFISGTATAQKEFSNWFFGNNAGLSFGGGAPVFLPGGNVASAASTSSMSDSQGNLLFYTDGVTVWGSNHQPMPNGTGLLGDLAGSQTVLVTYYPGNKDLYYIFTVGKGGADEFRYSVVDMRLNGGLGDVVIAGKNQSFNVPATEKITAVKHKNGSDLWLIFHVYQSDAFFAYLIDCSGVFVPTSSYIGSVISTPDNARGYLKASPDGKKLVSANFAGDFELFDFDNETGVISNFQSLPATSANGCGPYGIEFSPDSKLLYVSEAYTCAFPIPLYSILQYKLDPDINSTIASRRILDAGTTNLAGALQLGPDNKIYIAYNGASYLGVISNPNVYGVGATLSKQNLLQAPATSTFGLPNILAGFTRNTLAEDTIVCDGAPLVLKVDFKNASFLWSTGSTLDSIIVSTPGKYSVFVTSNGINGMCTINDTIDVQFAPSPKFKLPADTVVCQDKLPLLLAPTLPAGAYLWQDSTTNATYSAIAAGTYWLQVTSNGCSTRDSVLIASPVGTSFDLGKDTLICTGDSLQLTANATANSFLWSNGSTSNTIHIKAAGTYWCEAKYANGCSYRDSIKIDLAAVPVFTLGRDTVLCQDKFPLILNQNVPGATYLWQDSSTANTFSVPGTGTYWLRVTAAGCSARDTIQVNATPLTPFTLGADTVVCTAGSLALTGNPAYSSYLWSNGATTKSINVSSNGLYWCEATNASGCAYRDSIQVTIKIPPVVNLGQDTILCQNLLPFVLTRSLTGATYLWQDSSTANTFAITAPGTYWLEATVDGCATRDSININVNPLPVFSLGNDTTVCTAIPYLLTVNPAFARYKWNTGSTARSIGVNSTGWYWCEATNNTGCSYRDSIYITITTPPVVNIGRDTILCANRVPFILSQNIPGASYQWQDGSNQNSFAVTASGLYWLEASVNGCASRDSINVTVNAGPSFSLGADTTICTATAYVLTVNPAFTSYQWNTGVTSRSNNVTVTGWYWCEVTNNTGCSYRDSIYITVNRPPIVNLGRDTTLCSNQFPYVLTQSIPGASYAWQDGSTGSTFSIPANGTYWLEATVNGCSARDSITINSSPVTTFSLGADTTICSSVPYLLTVNPTFNSYLWSDGSTTRSISITSTGTYWCDVSNGSGCTARDSIRVTINVPPVVSLGKDTSLCPNQFPYQLNQAPVTGATYQWQDGSSSNSFSAPAPGIYWLQVTANGCSSRDTVNLTLSPVTTFSLGADTVICTANGYTLSAAPGFSSYLWSTGSTSRTINITADGEYWCEVSSGTGCSARDSIRVTLKVPPVVNLGKDTSLCQSQLPLILGQVISGASYLWQDGSTASSFTASASGVYWLQATLNGCSSRDSIAVNASPAAAFTLGSDTTICSGNPLALTVNPAFTNYLWNTGSTSRSINVNTSGTYWCEAGNGLGCSYRDSVVITVNPAPLINLGNDTAICSGAFPLRIGQAIPGATYLWQDGTTNSTYTVNGAGTYSVIVTLNGCSSRDTIKVAAASATTFSLGPDLNLCSATPVTLSAGITATNYLWNTGSTTQSILVNSSGDYWCEINRGTGCSFRDTVHVTIDVPISFSLGRDTVICDNRSLLLDVSNKGDSYLWQNNSTQPQYLVDKSGTYYVTVTKGLCTRSDTLVVTYSTQKTPDLGPDKTICPGEEILLDANVSSSSYRWQDGSSGRTYKVTAPGTYSVQVQSDCGQNTDEVVISLGTCRLMVPNAFTPGKSTNGVFKVLNAASVKDFNLQVFGRWGQRVFQTDKPLQGWDGKYNGVEQPAGTYVYTITFADPFTGERNTQKGIVILVR